MRSTFATRRCRWLAVAILTTASLGACTPPSQFDVVYNDRHPWDRREESAYRRWETEQTMIHIEYARRPDSEQRAYWTWRHRHPD